MIYGLSQKENEFLTDKLIEPLKKSGCKVYLFGSRATQSHKKFSDIDLLYTIDESSLQKIERLIFSLLSDIEDSKFPCKIDLERSQELASSYRAKVEAEKIEI